MNISPEKMIELCQGQLEAYNLRDIDLFTKYYHPEVQAFRLLNHELIFSGIDSLRTSYQKRFNDNPGLHCKLKSRIILNDTVLDEEWVTGVSNQDRPTHVVAIYKFKDDLISSIWFTY